ncbi:MAG: terminase gpA endonuclease subunit [Oceanicaulis sp.]
MAGGFAWPPPCPAFSYPAARFRRRVFAIKGDGGPGKPIWPKRASKSRTNHTLFMVGTNAASDQIYADLRVKAPGAGFCHFSAEYDAAGLLTVIRENGAYVGAKAPASFRRPCPRPRLADALA